MAVPSSEGTAVPGPWWAHVHDGDEVTDTKCTLSVVPITSLAHIIVTTVFEVGTFGMNEIEA